MQENKQYIDGSVCGWGGGGGAGGFNLMTYLKLLKLEKIPLFARL